LDDLRRAHLELRDGVEQRRAFLFRSVREQGAKPRLEGLVLRRERLQPTLPLGGREVEGRVEKSVQSRPGLGIDVEGWHPSLLFRLNISQRPPREWPAAASPKWECPIPCPSTAWDKFGLDRPEAAALIV
jgi:hypothetical protein